MADVASLADVCSAPGEAWDQGDIAEAVYFPGIDGERPGALVMPACDIEQGKVALWTFVALYPDVEIARGLVAKDMANWAAASGEQKLPALSKGQRTALEKIMKDLLDQRFPRYHWLPVSIGDSRAHVADFSCVTSLLVDDVRTNARRVATLRPSWREQVPARYSSFMARVGTVDFKQDELQKEVQRLAAALVE